MAFNYDFFHWVGLLARLLLSASRRELGAGQPFEGRGERFMEL